ncbi:lipocalin family protein [Arenibacter certesii]|uniref:Lipocalin-like domain-containing protein n=1 Tax=Arenibacter certesii TaxID=228955 RepID=A0A918IZB0_9FLAO|nr:lipocalin family protein [Arenibacter certesii]GGW39144.1 hypothetical protein GCM10007383_24820 [Arenibacter certesii]
MKKLNLICGLLIGFLILTSCSSNDNDERENDALIIGTWNGKTTSDGEIPENDIITFNSNNTATFICRSFCIEYNGIESSVDGTWELNKNILSLFWDENDVEHITVSEITKYTLTLKTITPNGKEYIEYYEKEI